MKIVSLPSCAKCTLHDFNPHFPLAVGFWSSPKKRRSRGKSALAQRFSICFLVVLAELQSEQAVTCVFTAKICIFLQLSAKRFAARVSKSILSPTHFLFRFSRVSFVKKCGLETRQTGRGFVLVKDLDLKIPESRQQVV